MDHILEPHQATMVERYQVEKVVLALQDTTTLNYTGLKATGGLVDLGGKETRGLLAHVGLAVTATGRPLGVFALDATFRDGDDKETESVRWQRGYERARDLARACPETRVVTVCDREGDIWTLLCEAASQDAALLVRARRSARRRVVLETDAKTDLWAHVAALPRLAGKTVKVAARGGEEAAARFRLQVENRGPGLPESGQGAGCVDEQNRRTSLLLIGSRTLGKGTDQELALIGRGDAVDFVERGLRMGVRRQILTVRVTGAPKGLNLEFHYLALARHCLMISFLNGSRSSTGNP